ncbi:hypothetical protein LCX93_06320 [Sulfurimonas sp. SWIR-19]|uniref:hypothetical protein n=1 Tax=Sulfurimonas sp. SWIR-19 TaxID=2878390 RepID=UPI001CF3F692|nr:hypothetical protein [Sulfurimonas sp. SWIR-19]UCM99156.1 hypothetical protein LCX93_06320 [Sulfurimonas sp. SWIR-19]
MCFVISIVGLFLAYNFYNAGNMLLAGGSVLVSAFFIFLMIRNILHVKKIREEKNDN